MSKPIDYSTHRNDCECEFCATKGHTMTDELDKDLDGIIASIAGDVYDYATDADSDRDEAVYSATVSHKKAIQALVERECNRAIEKTKTGYTRKRIDGGTCKYGHVGKYTTNPKGWRYCKECHHISDRKAYQRRKQLAELQSNTDGDKK